MNPWSVNWTDLSGNHHTDPLNINCHCFDATTAMVLNPAAWTNVPNGRFVANESSIRSFRGIRNMRAPTSAATSDPGPLQSERSWSSPTSSTVFSCRRLRLLLVEATSALYPRPRRSPRVPHVGAYSGGFGTIVTPFTGAVSLGSAPARWSPASRSSPASNSGAREIDFRALLTAPLKPRADFCRVNQDSLRPPGATYSPPRPKTNSAHPDGAPCRRRFLSGEMV